MCSVGEIGWRCFFFFALFATVTVIAQPLPPCPPLPHPERVDARAVLAHPAVRHALVQVDRVLENASRALPGMIATVACFHSV